MKRYLFILAIVLSIFIVSNGFGQTGALTNLNNFVKFTSENAQPVTNGVDVTVATMYGGALSISPVGSYLPIGNLGAQVWAITVTNKGNASATFMARVVATNSNLGGGTWTWRLSGSPTAILSPGGTASFSFAITNEVPALDNSWFSLLVQVSNISAPESVYAYYGTDGTTWYGGQMGVSTNGSSRSNDNYIYLQHGPAGPLGATNLAGFLTAYIAGPVLKISKTVEGITHPSGLYSGDLTRAEPGSYVTYRILASNVGSASATNIKIIDTTALTNYIAFVDVTGSSTNLTLNSVSTNGSGQLEVRFTNVNLPETVGNNFAVVRFRVRIK